MLMARLVSMYFLSVTVGGVAMALLGGTAAGAAPSPDKCSPADTRREATLTTGVFRRGVTAYATFCGRGEAMVRLGARSYSIDGGHCGDPGRFRQAGFGVIANRAVYSGATGLSILLKPGGDTGRVSVVDSIVQVAGLDLDATGSAVVAKGLDRGTFTLTSKAPEGMRVTGSWRCD